MDKERAAAALAGIPPGATLVTNSGLLRITRTVAEDGKTPAFRWQAGRVTSVPDPDEETAIKRLASYREELLDASAVFDADGQQLGPSGTDADWIVSVAGDEPVVFQGHIEGARRRARDLYNERGGLCEVTVVEAKSGKVKEQITRKVETMTETTKNGTTKKAAKVEAPLPRGFKVGVGADLAPGDQVVTDADRGPERVVSIGSGGVSRGRSYLKLMLEPVAESGGEERRRFISPRKEYPIKKATKAEAKAQAEKAEKKLAASAKAAEKKTAVKTEKSAPAKNGKRAEKPAPVKAAQQVEMPAAGKAVEPEKTAVAAE